MWPSQPQFSGVDCLVLFCPSRCLLSLSIQRPGQLARPLLKRPSSVSPSSFAIVTEPLPANLTDLGYEVLTSRTYFGNRYVASGASHHIYGINTGLVKQSQITASAPADTVIQNGGLGFLQGLYPPVGEALGSNVLRNGTVVQIPSNGYYLILLQSISVGANSENPAWLEGATNCANAQTSSDDFSGELFLNLLSET